MTDRRRAFASWFRAQYGQRPSARQTVTQLAGAVNDAESALRKAKDALRERDEYDAREDAALKAWCAARERRK